MATILEPDVVDLKGNTFGHIVIVVIVSLS